MTPEQRKRVEDVFHRLIGLPRETREPIVGHLCRGDDIVIAEVNCLLDADAQHPSRHHFTVLDSIRADVAEIMTEGMKVGPYTILSVLGEGGFGVVYLAERREPFVQRVALKVIKPGMDSRAVIARFEQERQALALMDHPNVAHVHDGGVTSPDLGSRPYFVMELVQGLPITDYCDQNKLTVRERLELLIPVCEAIQHAHHKGIIHRDIKPSNILVEVADNHAIPKVIDFGIAKAVSHTLTEKTIFTEQGQLIGTPEYTSPEQAEMTAAGIDTRSDLYSLGVVLYELLTGALPFDRETLRGLAWAKIVETIREVDPPKPSTRLSTLGEAATTVAERRSLVGSQALVRVLKEDLDWITLKAMEKDRSRRYSTAAEFANDIRNYLSGHMVVARPPTARYRARKFLRRNWTLVTTGLLVAACLTIGLAVSLSLLRRTMIAEAGARSTAYDANIAAAASFLALDDASSAYSRLQACPENLRGWEWRRLAYSADATTMAVEYMKTVSDVAFAADGATLVCLGGKSFLRCDAKSGKLIGQSPFGPDFDSHEDQIARFGLADFGARIFLSYNGRPCWWLTDSGRQPIDLGPGIEYDSAVAAATACRAPVATLVTTAPVSLSIIHGTTVRAIALDKTPHRIAISDDGSTVAAAWLESGTVTVRAWDVASLSALPGRITAAASGSVRHLAVAAGATVIAASTPGGTLIWRTSPDGSVATLVMPGDAGRLAIAPDRAWIAAVQKDNQLRLFNVVTGDQATFRGHRFEIGFLNFSADSARLVTSSRDNDIYLWSVRPDAYRVGTAALAGAASNSQARRMLLFNDSTLTILDLQTSQTFVLPCSPAVIKSAMIDTSGRKVAVLSNDGLALLDVSTREVIRTWTIQDLGFDPGKDTGPRRSRIAFEPPPGTRLVLAAPFEGRSSSLYTADCATGSVRKFATVSLPFTATLSNGSSGPLVAGFAHQLLSWPHGLDAPSSTIKGRNSPGAIAVSPDRRSIAVATTAGLVYLSRPEGPDVDQFVDDRSPQATAATWINRNRLATGTRDGTVNLWATDPLRRLSVERFGSAVVGMHFDEPTETLWVALGDGTAHALRAKPSPH